MKCKSKESRTSALKLLSTLCKNNIKCEEFILQKCLLPLTLSCKPHKSWAYIPSSESRSSFGYSGIKNLGCVCYMISMLQQFYMIPQFRYLLLQANDKKAPNLTKNDIDDNLLHQLQTLFGFLELTERIDYNPNKFCYSFKDVDGNPTNIAIQQDAQEFLNMLFGRLETLLKDTTGKYLLQSIFGGKTCSQLICREGCKNISKNYEDFYDLSVGVKGIGTLKESLEKFNKEELISDYFCNTCQKKVNIVKRVCISELPNILIVHLQRIIFNYDTFVNEKINSKLEFPTSLNLEPYTEEGIESREKDLKDFDHGHSNQYYEYKLIGIIQHYGTAEAGHYYSFINTKNKGKYK